MRVRGLWMALAACLSCLATLTSTPSLAAASSMICVVRVGKPVDEKLVQRVLGQTSDLPLSILRVSGPIEPELDAARARADELARSFQARGVVWFVTDARGDLMVFVVDAETRRLFVHRIDHRSGSPSAVLESASLIVRDVLQALTDGRPIGPRMVPGPHDDHETVDVRDVLAPPLRAFAEPAAAPPLLLAPTLPGPRWIPFTAVGVRAVFADSTLSYALHQRLGVSVEHVEFGMELTVGATDVRTDAFASLLVRRHTIGAFGGWRWKLAASLTASADVHAGIALFFRSTRPVSPTTVPFASRTLANAIVGPEARVAWTPGPSWLKFSMGVGADVVFAPPTTSYETMRGETVETLALWPVQPHFTALLEMWPLP